MNTTPWHLGPLVSLDTETTGVDPETARIVTAAVIVPERTPEEWLVAVDVDIPAEATAVHKVSTEHARAHGAPAAVVLDEVCESVAVEMRAGAALVVMNAPYDVTLLDRECARYGVATLAERLGRPVAPVVDPLTIDRAADRYRPGRRTLTALAEHYGVQLTDAHSAAADAEAALLVSLRLAEAFPELQVEARRLHAWQVTWHERWASGFEAHLRESGKDPEAAISRFWPARPTGGES